MVMPGAAGIQLNGPAIRFAGTTTRDDIAKSLGQKPKSLIFWTIAVGAPLMIGSLTLSSTRTDPFVLFMFAFAAAAGFFWYLRSGHARANRYCKSSPKSLIFHTGWISDHFIHIESVHGAADYPWESIVGIDLRHDRITLALNPQHQAFIFLPKRFLSEQDWDRLFTALIPLAPALQFQLNWLLQADSRRIAAGAVPELTNVPTDAIILDGTLTNRQLMRSPLGMRWLYQLCVFSGGTIAVLFLFFWSIGLIEMLGERAWLLGIIPALFLIRLYQWLAICFFKKPKNLVKLKAAVSETKLQLATARATALIYWSTFDSAKITDDLICLQETSRSRNVVPLPRSALADPQQWSSLVDLVKRKVDENESAETIEAALVGPASTNSV